MHFYQRFIPGLAISSHLIGDEKTKQAVVIDVPRDVTPYIDHAKEAGLRITHIIETHVHADFVSGSCELKARLGDQAEICCSGYGGEDWHQSFADRHLQEGDQIVLGDLEFGFLHTPGHTPEHLTITLKDTSRSTEVPWLAFTGDFLFVGDVGRPDLLGEKEKKELAHQLYESVFQKLPNLPRTVEIYPSHGAGSLCGKAIGSRRSSTVGFEQQFNPSLQAKSEDAWTAALLEDMPLAPDYFTRMKKVNRDGPTILGTAMPGEKRLSTETVAEHLDKGTLILDVRSKEAFAAAHIPKAVNIPFDDNLSSWAGWVLPYDEPLLIVTDAPDKISEVSSYLTRVGFDDIVGHLDGGFGEWETEGRPLDYIKTLSVHDLARERKATGGGELCILDVRTESEWNEGYIEGALHIHAGEVSERLDELPKDCPVAVVCGSGYRASIGASLLKRAGREDVTNIIGGMTAWYAAKLPVIKPE